MNKSKVALSTIDNPYNPITQFDLWFAFDEQKGYHSCSLLDRIFKSSEQLSDEENEIEKEKAIDEIIKNDFQNIYIKVKV